MHIKQYILVITSLLLFACQKDVFTFNDESNDNTPYAIGFWVGGGVSGDTRTAINEDGQSISWEQGDKVALWALQGSSYTFQNQPFGLWFRTTDNSQAFFASTRVSSMPEGKHTYYACYPTPVSYNGTTATFTIPSVQDGKMSGGADIMVAQGDGPALEKLYNPEAGDYLIDDGLSLNMRHLIHALRFYVPQSQWGFPENETVERIIFTMPSSAVAATGTVTADVASETAGLTMTNSGSNTVSLNLREPITSSAANANGGVSYDYAAAAIMPATYTGDLVVKVFSQTKASQVTIANVNREMQAGHITPVGLNCSETIDQYCLRFVYGGNNLGEYVTEIRVKYTDENGASQILTIPGNQFIKDGYYDVDLTDWAPINFSALRSKLNGQEITVEYESANAIVSNKVKLPDVTQKGVSNVTLTVPYLFEQNFNDIGAFSDGHDNWRIGSGWDSWNYSDTYNESASLDGNGLSGWSASRVGVSNGTVRICCRFETGAGFAAYYRGRLDSPALSAIKSGSNVKLKVYFDYGGNRNEYALSLSGKPNANPIMSFGTTTETGNPDPGTGQIDGEVLAIDSEYGNIPQNSTPKIVEGCTNSTRLTWLVSTNRDGGFGGNGNYWLYLDNIRVQIVSE